MSNSDYEKILKHEVEKTWIIWIFIFIAIGLFIYINKSDFYNDTKKWVKVISNALILICVISASIYFITYTYQSTSDIKNEAYITYEGDFYINYYRGNYVDIKENGKKRTLSYKDASTMEGGTYSGVFVYAKKTGRILEMKKCSKISD